MQDKSVIILGNGASLAGSKLGKKIDEFDVVVRINSWKTKGYEEDVGTKTTIWATYNTWKRTESFIKEYMELGYSLEYIKELVKDIEEIWIVSWDMNHLFNPGGPRYINVLGLGNKTLRIESYPFSKKLTRKLEHPSTGLHLIWLLTQMYSKIYIAGYDIYGFKDDYYYYKSNIKTKNLLKGSTLHKKDIEYKMIKDWIKSGQVEYLTNESKIEKGKYIFPYCDESYHGWEQRK